MEDHFVVNTQADRDLLETLFLEEGLQAGGIFESSFDLSVTEEVRKDIPNADQMPLVVADIFVTHSVQSLVSIMLLSFPDKPSPDKVMNKHPSDSY